MPKLDVSPKLGEKCMT